MPEKLGMIPYEPHMGAGFVPYDAIEWHMEQQQWLAAAPEPVKQSEVKEAPPVQSE